MLLIRTFHVASVAIWHDRVAFAIVERHGLDGPASVSRVDCGPVASDVDLAEKQIFDAAGRLFGPIHYERGVFGACDATERAGRQAAAAYGYALGVGLTGGPRELQLAPRQTTKRRDLLSDEEQAVALAMLWRPKVDVELYATKAMLEKEKREKEKREKNVVDLASRRKPGKR